MLDAAPLTYTTPPFPDVVVQDVNVVLDSSVPVIENVFPSPTDPQSTAPFTELPDRERLANEHEVTVTSLDASNRITGSETLTTSDGVTVTDVRLSFPEEIEKREYASEDSDGVNAMEDTLNSDPVALKRKEVSDGDEVNGLVTADPPSGLMFMIP